MGSGMSAENAGPVVPQLHGAPIGGRTGGGRHDKGDSGFRAAVAAAAKQLNRKQLEGDMTISKAEMEDIVQLNRQLENLHYHMRQRQMSVISSWNKMEREDLLDHFAGELHREMGRICPDLDVLLVDIPIKNRAGALLRMLGTAVHLHDQPQVAMDVLTQLGALHRKYGVTIQFFHRMKEAFFAVFPRVVGEEVFAATESEWKKFWSIVIEVIEQGSTSLEGERYAVLHSQNSVRALQRDFRILIKRQNECPPRKQFVGVMYAKALDMFGDLSNFHALTDLRASARVFQSYVDIVEHLQDESTMQEYLVELGARHTAYNVSEEQLRSFTEPFIFACHHFLEDRWNPALEARLLWLFTFMTTGITSGMSGGMDSLENKRAPTTAADFCLIFTDIEASTVLWQKDPDAMALAVKNHHRLIRGLIAEHGAYEVKTVGDSFIIAVKDMLVALKLALSLQLELIRLAPIAPDFEMIENTEGHGDANAWHSGTVRVRIGIEHCTEATATYDSIHRRYDYYGPSVNRCARIEAAACGGQILMSKESYKQLESIPEFRGESCPGPLRSLEIPSPSVKLDSRGLDKFISVSDYGVVPLKGIKEPVHLVSVLPADFSGRTFVNKLLE